MALQVWLPLNGNLNNQGLADVTISSNGSTLINDGKIGKCYKNANCSITNLNGLKVFPMTICFWAKTDATTSWQQIVMIDDNNLSQIHGVYIADSARLKYEYSPSININDSATSEWHHYAFTINNGESIGYYDGIQKQVSTESITADVIGRLRIGTSGSVYLNDVRIYDHVLSPREVAEIAKGLVLHYPLNDAYYTGQYINTVFDTSGYNNNGTSYYLLHEVNSPRYSSAAAFDGQNIYISLISSSINNLIRGGNTPFTVAFWVSHDDSTRAILFGDYGLGGINFNIELSAYHDIRFYCNGSPDKIFGTIPASTWTHICIVYNGTGLKCYSNGVLIGTYSSSLAQKTKNSNIEYRLGKDSRSDSTMFYGRMSDFRIYATALTADQVKQLYEAPISLANNGTLFANEFNET